MKKQTYLQKSIREDTTIITKDNKKGALWLLQTLGSTFPVGGFQHSFGLETYIKKGKITNVASLKEYLIWLLKQNISQFEGLAFAKAHKLGVCGNLAELKELDQTMTAMRLSKENRTASLKMGVAFLRQVQSLEEEEQVTTYFKQAKADKSLGNYCVVAGYFAGLYNTTLEESLLAFLFSSINNLLQVGIKSIPLGQTEGQRMFYELYPEVLQTCENIAQNTQSPLSNFTPYQDIMSMQHEVLYTRLYMS